jgi:thymidylate synthase (FAD)
MKIRFIKPSTEITLPMPGTDMLKHIEKAGRTCYKSEDKITEDSAVKFVEMLIKRGHESVLEHCGFSVRFICDRGVSHELVRHRLCSFSQESTRYVGYGDAIEFIIPSWSVIEPYEREFIDIDQGLINLKSFDNMTDSEYEWQHQCASSAFSYQKLLKQGWRPEQARSVLPNSLKTEIVITGNLRQWRLVFSQRDSMAAHPQMRELMEPLHIKASGMIPGVFNA